MIRCPKCNGLNNEKIQDVFYCQLCSNGWTLDINAQKLFTEWAELDKSDRLVAQTMGPGGTYQVQQINWDKVSRRTELAKDIKNNHQHNLDLSPDIWYRIFEDAY